MQELVSEASRKMGFLKYGNIGCYKYGASGFKVLATPTMIYDTVFLTRKTIVKLPVLAMVYAVLLVVRTAHNSW